MSERKFIDEITGATVSIRAVAGSIEDYVAVSKEDALGLINRTHIIVPKEPTEEDINAIQEVLQKYDCPCGIAGELYKAMIKE